MITPETQRPSLQGGEERQIDQREEKPESLRSPLSPLISAFQLDGRDVIVAIFDSGVDPGAEGLLTTSEGKPKVIDIVDCSGSGDVDTTAVREANDGAIDGLSGRKLRLNPEWKGPFRVGVVPWFERVLPRECVDRIRKQRKETFEQTHQRFVAELQRAEESLAAEAKKDSEALREQLNELAKAEDPGPISDCVLFKAGEVWQVVIDLDESGDLRQAKPMTEYRLARDWRSLGSTERFNFGINVYQDGAVLSVVGSGSHGTHVAGIVAANYPADPDLNGVAPGAQIISFKIGDTRLGTMETGTSMIRALSALTRCRADVMNMSYGEPSSWIGGRFADVAAEVVQKHNVVLVASAGNNGPALQTAGAPGGSFPHFIGVGAYFSPDMTATLHSVRDGLAESNYTWSSRGPALDGASCPTVCAPGGAISSVPQWTLSKSALMNGTSMSSPNCAGNVALLVSALKKLGIAYSPHSIRLALQNTARPIEDAEPFSSGAGLIQVVDALKWLQTNGAAHSDVHVAIDVPKRNNARGIYLRDTFETTSPQEVEVRVRCVYKEPASASRQLDTERRLVLSVKGAPAGIVAAPASVFVSGAGERLLTVRIDPTALPLGAHFAELLAVDSASPNAGPVCRFPITIIKAAAADRSIRKSIELRPNHVERMFFVAPDGASHAELRLKGTKVESAKRIVVHVLPSAPLDSLKFLEVERYFTVTTGSTDSLWFRAPKGTFEIAVGQNWNALGVTLVDVEIDFHGLQAGSSYSMHDGAGSHARVGVTCAIGDEELNPTVLLKKLVSSVRPSSFAITTSGQVRDQLPNGKAVFQAVLKYSYSFPEAGEATIRLPMSSILYESVHEAQFWMAQNTNGKVLATGDAFPKPTKFPKGDVTFRVVLRHDNSSYLERLKELPLTVERDIKEIALSVHPDINAVLVPDGSKVSLRKLRPGERSVFFVASPDASAVPKEAKKGALLHGALHLQKTEDAVKKLGGIPFQVFISSHKAAAKPAPAPRPEVDTLDKAVLQAKVDFLSSLGSKKSAEFDALAKELIAQNPRHVPLLKVLLRVAGTDSAALLTATDAILAAIDAAQLAAFFGTRVDASDPAAVRQQKEKEAEKALLIDALQKRALHLASPHPDEAWKQLKKWADFDTDSKLAATSVKSYRAAGRNGAALKVLSKALPSLVGDASEKALVAQRLQLLRDLRADHLVALYSRVNLVDFPPSAVLL